MDKSEKNYQIHISKTLYTQPRIIHSLRQDTDINLYWMGTSAYLEKELRPIRFPLHRGLLGYRIFIIHKDHQIKFSTVKKLADLQNFQGVQGQSWSDNEILNKAGLNQTQIQYEHIFHMINAGDRFDYFSRGIVEAFSEVDSHIKELPNLAIESEVLLVYPFSQFFFTNPSNEELAEALERGFEKAYQDGSFLDFFLNHPRILSVFEKVNIENRIRIDIPNPQSTQETADIPAQYFHSN